jgi:prepilin-type N-terminal cleavage/methylation domain-containing protein
MTTRLRRDGDERGFTLIEFMVAMSLMVVLLTVSMTIVKIATGAVTTTQQQQNLNEEARQAINRMSRDIRQAKTVITAVNPDGAGFSTTGLVAVRFTADFDGDGCIAGVPGVGVLTCLAYNASNPEDITYCFQPFTKQLYVIDNSAVGVTPVTTASTSCSGGQPLLAGDVSAFKLSYRSNVYRDDLNPSDGVTTWTELDESGVPDGNNNGALDIELPNVDSVVLNLTMKVGGHQQQYRTQVDLRNQSQ